MWIKFIFLCDLSADLLVLIFWNFFRFEGLQKLTVIFQVIVKFTPRKKMRLTKFDIRIKFIWIKFIFICDLSADFLNLILCIFFGFEGLKKSTVIFEVIVEFTPGKKTPADKIWY